MPTLDEQISTLVALGYPELLSCTEADFRSSLRRLEPFVPRDEPLLDVPSGRMSVAIVINHASAPVFATLPRVKREGRAAIERLHPRTPQFFKPTRSVKIPSGHAYLLLGIDRGNDTLNAVPLAAQEHLAGTGRSPLTVEEGVALLTQSPEFLQPNHCFMMLGSRGNDKRVPALWLSGKVPKLGWCWEGNPHTWLGFASCVTRSDAVRIARSTK